jgi:hypothetical protein
MPIDFFEAATGHRAEDTIKGAWVGLNARTGERREILGMAAALHAVRASLSRKRRQAAPV